MLTSLKPVPGFSYASIKGGIKKDMKDICLIAAKEGANSAAVFTRSQVKAAPVLVSQANIKLSYGVIYGYLINSGNANACTGEYGLHLAQSSAETLAAELNCANTEVLLASTGVIGVKLDADIFEKSIPNLVKNLASDEESFREIAETIMTTDTVPKYHSVSQKIDDVELTVSGVSKGSGMIRPNMATFLGCVMTDAPLSAETVSSILDTIADTTFNAVTVDGDTSTNDTFVLMASRVNADNEELSSKLNDTSSLEYKQILTAIHQVALELSRAVARDGEGASKYVEVIVTGAKDRASAKQVAFTIAESPLVKTALFGADANWGRVAGAAGRAGVTFDQNKMSITFASIPTFIEGQVVDFSEDEAFKALSKDEVTIHVHLGERPYTQEDYNSAQEVHPHEGVARVMTCDLTYEYIRINGEYRS